MDARAIARLADAGAREAQRAVRDGAVRRERTRDDARGGTTTTTMGREPRGNGAREGDGEDDGEDGRGGGGWETMGSGYEDKPLVDARAGDGAVDAESASRVSRRLLDGEPPEAVVLGVEVFAPRAVGVREGGVGAEVAAVGVDL